MDSAPIELRNVALRGAESVSSKPTEVKSTSVESLSDATARIQEEQSDLRAEPTKVQAQELELNKALRKFGATELKIELRDAGEGPVFHIVDKKTGKELLQIPSEYKLSIERTVEMLRGALFDKRV